MSWLPRYTVLRTNVAILIKGMFILEIIMSHNRSDPNDLDRQVGHTVQAQIPEQSDQGLHFLPFYLNIVQALLIGRW